MKIILVKGGLGNQLFQVSYAFYLNQHRSSRVLLLTGLLNRYAARRDFYFNQFPPGMLVNSSYLLAMFCRICGFVLRPLLKRRIFIESSKGYSAASELPTAQFIDAYLQNFDQPDYSRFIFNNPAYRAFIQHNLQPHFTQLASIPELRNCLHIRGGDLKMFFSPDQVSADVAELYAKLTDHSPEQEVLIVTDDEPYARSFFPADAPVCYQSANWAVDFLTLARSSQLGIVESTFSIWAAIYGYLTYGRLQVFTSRHCLGKYPLLAYLHQHQRQQREGLWP